MSKVARDVPANLFTPVGGKLQRPLIKFPSVPEITIDENGESESGEDDIRLACEPCGVDSEAIAPSV